MVFREKTAWIMSLALILAGAFYWRVIIAGSAEIGGTMPPLIPIMVIYVVIVIAVAIIGHIIAAVGNPKEAGTPSDEREFKIVAHSRAISQTVFGVAILGSLGLYLFSYDGHALFHCVFASLMLSQLVEYIMQIILFRKSVAGATA